MTSRSHPSSRSARSGGGDRGDRRGIGEHELDPGRRQRRVDRQIGRPGLEHRQHRHDRLGRPRKQQRHTLHPGPPPGRPTGAPTGWPPHRARDRSTSGPRRSAPPPPGRGPPARRTTPESTPACSPAGSTPPDYPTHPAGRAHRHRADRSTTAAGAGSAVIATNTRSNRPAKSETSKFENGCPAPAVLRKSSSPAPEKNSPKPSTRPTLVI